MKATIEDVLHGVAKARCEQEHLFFTRYFFKFRQDMKFLVNWHHHLVSDVVEDVIQGRRKNVAISLSPGGTKTELVVINFVARGLALNPRARFLHLSASDVLASLNSSTAKEIVTSDEYQAFWPLKIADDAKSKKRWNVLVGGRPAGGVYATSIGGQVTGFRAGRMAPGFQGALIVDDPIKPEDAFSSVKIDAANRKLISTVKSRKATPDTPIIIIMQRVAEQDAIGFVEGGALGDDWSFVKIPAIIDDAYLSTIEERYRKLVDTSQGVGGRHSYWPYKERLPELLKMEQGQGQTQHGQKVSRYVFTSQWMQSPTAMGGNIIHGKDFQRYRVLPKIKYRKVYADTAQKTAERNDFTVFEEWGYGIDGRIYLISLERGKWEAPELQRRAVAFWAKCRARDVEKYGECRKMEIEDKASGTGLIQTIKAPPYNIPINAVERNKDKLTRVMDGLPYIENGSVFIPEESEFTTDFVAECEGFTADDTHAHDDQVDALMDAINDMLGSGNLVKQFESIGKNFQAQAKSPGSIQNRILSKYRRL